jgi:methylated-DNA-[protein]-cysteine S-methyltransferase
MQYEVNYFDIPLLLEITNGIVFSVHFVDSVKSPSTALFDDLYAFAKGDKFSLKFSLENASTNIRSVLLKALSIPFGKVVSYGELSKAVYGSSRHSRFVGFAMGQNPIPVIVPCHRVVFANGAFNGFSASVSIKHRLLSSEGVYPNNGKIDKTFFAHF